MAERLPLAIAPDTDGPKVRLGVVWFLLAVGAAVADQTLLAGVSAAAAALAADQVVRLHRGPGDASWREVKRLVADPVRLPAVLAGAALPLAALGGSDLLAAAVGAIALVVLAYRLWAGPVGGAVGDVAVVLAAAVPVGLAAAAPVLLAGVGRSAAVVLLVLVAAYDAGDFLVGTDAGMPWEGPLAGVLAVAACGFGAWVIAPEPLGPHGVLALAVGVGLLAPFGPPAASVLVGDGRRPARFVRRLDTLLVAGPVAAWAANAVVAAASTRP